MLILLDEKGKEFRSLEFSAYLQKKMNAGIKQLVFVIGGPYGFSETVYKTAKGKISLSKMINKMKIPQNHRSECKQDKL